MTLISVLYQSVHMRSGGRHFFRAAFDRECEKADRKKKKSRVHAKKDFGPLHTLEGADRIIRR